MTTLGELNFAPIPLRPRRWRAEVTGLSYVIFQTNAGFVIDCQRTLEGSTGSASIPGIPTALYDSFETAVQAANALYRKSMR